MRLQFACVLVGISLSFAILCSSPLSSGAAFNANRYTLFQCSKSPYRYKIAPTPWTCMHASVCSFQHMSSTSAMWIPQSMLGRVFTCTRTLSHEMSNFFANAFTISCHISLGIQTLYFLFVWCIAMTLHWLCSHFSSALSPYHCASAWIA